MPFANWCAHACVDTFNTAELVVTQMTGAIVDSSLAFRLMMQLNANNTA